jgi:hypothetical protein
MLIVTSPPPANDNALSQNGPEAPRDPIVRTPRGRARATYASKDGVILPLAFARRMSGWDAARGHAARGALPQA